MEALTTFDHALKLDLDSVQVSAGQTYDMVGVLSYGKGLFHRAAVEGHRTSYSTFYRLHSSQIVLSQLFGWEGALAMVTEEFAGKYVSSQFPTFSVRNGVDKDYVAWALKSPSLWQALRSKGKGMGVRRITVSPAALLSSEIVLPSLTEQRRLANKLDAVAARTDHFSQHLDGIDADLSRFLSAEFAIIIRDAPRRPLGEVAPLKRRPVTVNLEAEYAELGVRSFGRGTFHKAPLSGADLAGKRVFRVCPGDLMFMIVFAWEGAVAVARPEDEGRIGSHRFLTCVPVERKATAEFLKFYFLSPEGLGRLQAASPGSAGRNRTLGLQSLFDIQVPVPPIHVQRAFDQLCAMAATISALNEAQRADFDTLRASLLDRAFRGEL